MVEVKRVRAGDDREVLDPNRLGHARRPGDRAVTWLVVAFVCIAVIVLGFAIARSRMARPTAPTLSTEATAIQPGQGFRVVRIKDGDTIVIVGQDNIDLELRLAGIDAPERDQPFGAEATTFLESLLTGQTVHLDNVEREKYGRVLAHAYLGSRWIDLEIVQHGCAWVYPDIDSRALREAEAKARADKAGLWSSDSPTPPWEWRKDGK